MSDTNEILKLFKENKLLVRGMVLGKTCERTPTGIQWSYDFSNWAGQVDLAQHSIASCLSTTLLVPGERIPTYKPLGLIINSDKTEIVHVADSDSGSHGETTNGTFWANPTDLSTLEDLANRVKETKSSTMNEVNVNIKEDAIIGLFTSKGFPKLKAEILLAQEYYKMHTGRELPIFLYDDKKGEIEPLEMSSDEKKDFLLSMKSQLKTLTIGYDIDTDYTQENKQKTLYQNEKNQALLNFLSKSSDQQKKTTMTQQHTLTNHLSPDR